MTDEQQEALETMRSGFGLCVGQLREDEMAAFNFLCKEGLAKRSYRGAMGLLGLAIAERDQPSKVETYEICGDCAAPLIGEERAKGFCSFCSPTSA